MAAALLLAGCTAEPDSRQQDARAQAKPTSNQPASDTQQDCLLLVWSDQDAPDPEFDRSHDQVSGGAISCATGSSASQFRDALEAIKIAAASGDREALIREIGIPMMYIDAQGNRRDFAEAGDLDKVFDEIFDERTIELLTRLDLAAMSVTRDQGGYFELGSIWLAVPQPGARPKIVTVNRQAIEEAVEAAREKALGTPSETTSDGSN